MSFAIFQNEKTPLQTIKKEVEKVKKTGIYPKGLVHGFGQKLVTFPDFYFKENRPEK